MHSVETDNPLSHPYSRCSLTRRAPGHRPTLEKDEHWRNWFKWVDGEHLQLSPELIPDLLPPPTPKPPPPARQFDKNRKGPNNNSKGNNNKRKAPEGGAVDKPAEGAGSKPAGAGAVELTEEKKEAADAADGSVVPSRVAAAAGANQDGDVDGDEGDDDDDGEGNYSGAEEAEGDEAAPAAAVRGESTTQLSEAKIVAQD